MTVKDISLFTAVFGNINVKCINNIPNEEQAPLSADK